MPDQVRVNASSVSVVMGGRPSSCSYRFGTGVESRTVKSRSASSGIPAASTSRCIPTPYRASTSTNATSAIPDSASAARTEVAPDGFRFQITQPFLSTIDGSFRMNSVRSCGARWPRTPQTTTMCAGMCERYESIRQPSAHNTRTPVSSAWRALATAASTFR